MLCSSVREKHERAKILTRSRELHSLRAIQHNETAAPALPPLPPFCLPLLPRETPCELARKYRLRRGISFRRDWPALLSRFPKNIRRIVRRLISATLILPRVDRLTGRTRRYGLHYFCVHARRIPSAIPTMRCSALQHRMATTTAVDATTRTTLSPGSRCSFLLTARANTKRRWRVHVRRRGEVCVRFYVKFRRKGRRDNAREQISGCRV